jgi:Fe-S cluster assembly iron-binding protein IscA
MRRLSVRRGVALVVPSRHASSSSSAAGNWLLSKLPPVRISSSAGSKIAALGRQNWVERPKSAALRLGVEGGGCSGFSYNFALDDKLDQGLLNQGEKVLRASSPVLSPAGASSDGKDGIGSDALKNGVFLAGTNDVLFLDEASGARLLVDRDSLAHVAGSTIDWKEDLMRSSFAVVSNPNAELSCGCGTSFASTAATPADEEDDFADLGFDFIEIGQNTNDQSASLHAT